MIQRLPVFTFTACQSCRAPCCLGSVVYLSSLDVYRIARTVGLDWPSFAYLHPTVDWGFVGDGSKGRTTHAVRLRQRADRACEMAVPTPDGTIRCGIHSVRPTQCRLYPYHVRTFEQVPYQVAMGNNAACPSTAITWFNRAVDELGDVCDDAVADEALAVRVERRWNTLVEGLTGTVRPERFLNWAWDLYEKLGAIPPIAERAAWQLAAYRTIAETALPAFERPMSAEEPAAPVEA